MSLKKSHPNRRHWRRHKSTFQTEMLEPRHLLAGMALISEFMASNDTTIQDEDLEFSDWLEITNVGDAALNLDGYAITDDPADRAQWRFPNINLDAGKTLLVFASGKDRTNPDSELHASFRLNAGGEYLALVAPDGATTLQEFAPEYLRHVR